MLKYLICFGGPVMVGANAVLLNLSLSRADSFSPVLLHTAGIAAGLAATYWACKTWYHRGKQDVYEEFEERWKRKEKEES